jgi:hypothetical protein
MAVCPVPQKLLPAAEDWVSSILALEQTKLLVTMYGDKGSPNPGTTSGDNYDAVVAAAAALAMTKKEVVYLVELLGKVNKATLLLSPSSPIGSSRRE